MNTIELDDPTADEVPVFAGMVLRHSRDFIQKLLVEDYISDTDACILEMWGWLLGYQAYTMTGDGDLDDLRPGGKDRERLMSFYASELPPEIKALLKI